MRRFTLVELATVVAIVAVLAAIAIPLLAEAQLKARYAEVYPNLEGLFDATLAYTQAKEGVISVADIGPDVAVADLGRRPHPWSEVYDSFGVIGWRPDGHVRAQYVWSSIGDDTTNYCWLTVGSGDSGAQVFVHALSDMDDDNTLAIAARCESRLSPFCTTDRVGLTAKADWLDKY